MKTNKAFGKSLRQLRQKRGVTQESFSAISSRTYISELERGQKSPTIEKVEILAKVLRVHPLTLLCLTYMQGGKYRSLEALFRRIRADLGK